jgi:DNA-binding transcriptional ArsR family regulator
MEKAKTKDLDELLEEALANAPSIEGYSIRQLSETIECPWSTTRWHLGRMEARGIVEPYRLGRANIYRLKKNIRGKD